MALLVARVFADDAHDASPPHDAAAFTEALDGRTDFHEKKTKRMVRISGSGHTVVAGRWSLKLGDSTPGPERRERKA